MKRSVAIALTLALFVSGVAVGALGMHLLWSSGKIRSWSRSDRPRAGHIGEQLQAALELTPEQQIQVEAILQRNHQQARDLRRELGPKVRQIIERSADEVRALLTAEQQGRFDALRRDQKRRFEGLLLGRPGGDGISGHGRGRSRDRRLGGDERGPGPPPGAPLERAPFDDQGPPSDPSPADPSPADPSPADPSPGAERL